MLEVRLVMPTTRSKQRFDDVQRDTRPLTASIFRPTRTPTDGSRPVAGPHPDWTPSINPLYVGVPAACAGLLLSLAVLGGLLLRHGRHRRRDGGRRPGKSAALLPSYTTSSPSPPRSAREPCVCLQCSRPVFAPAPAAAAAYAPVETRS